MISIQNKNSITRTKTIIALGLLSTGMLFHSATIADTTAVFNAGGNDQITIEYRDENHVRMSAPGGGYMIITGGEGYIASRDGNDWTVFAVRDMAEMMSRFGANFGAMSMGGDDISIVDAEGDIEVRNTGRRETVAGIQGEVYEVTATDADGNRETTELVMSDDRDARDAYQGFMRITTLMGEMVGIQGLDQLMDDAYGLGGKAVLRADNDWILTSLNTGNIPDANFNLPAEPMAIPSIPGFGGQAGDSSSGSSGGGFAAGIGGWLGGEVNNAGQVASDEAESVVEEAAQETRNEVTDGIRDGVRRGLRSLFD